MEFGKEGRKVAMTEEKVEGLDGGCGIVVGHACLRYGEVGMGFTSHTCFVTESGLAGSRCSPWLLRTEVYRVRMLM